MEGRTTASFRFPCSDVAAPARRSFWVELLGLAGFPAVLSDERRRYFDANFGVEFGNCPGLVGNWWATLGPLGVPRGPCRAF